jgi:DNA mismatch repair protein MutL
VLDRLILCYHRTAFRLTHDGHEMIAYPGSTEPRHGIAAVWGREAAREMVEFRYDSPSLNVFGFVSKPSLSKASRSAQVTFVNGRFVRSRAILHAFDSAFKHLMTTDRHPVLALFVEIAPELVDVNVHPAKVEVRFTRDGDIYSAVHRAIQNALLTGGLVPEVTVQPSLPTLSRPDPSGGAIPPRSALSTYARTEVDLPGADFTRDFATRDFAGTVAASPLSGGTGHIGQTEQIETGETVNPFAEPTELAETKAAVFRPTLAAHWENESGQIRPEAAAYIGFDGYKIGRLRVLAQSRNTYIVAETDDALLLIDQHIAHERVLYEQMLNGATEKATQWGVVAQHLALPQTIEFTAREARIVQERLTALHAAGFLLEAFGGETFVLRAVPATVAAKNYIGTLREIVDEMTNASVSRRLLVPHEAAVIMASCKMAVKKGDPLTMDEMTRLLADLARMQNPFTCPHGRPILLALPHAEMDRKFHRVGPH